MDITGRCPPPPPLAPFKTGICQAEAVCQEIILCTQQYIYAFVVFIIYCCLYKISNSKICRPAFAE